VTINAAELNEILEFAVKIARQAGQITLKYYRKEPETKTKADGSFVTIADREAESYLRSAIAEKFPEDSVLGEEEGETRGSSGRRWIIDPIDGTYSFVHGVPFYGVLIGLETDGEPTAGVINLPAVNEVIYAAKGLGCFWNGKRTAVSAIGSLEESLLLCTDFLACNRYGFGPALAAIQSRVKTSRTWGDCYGHVLVATGRAEVMLDPVMNLWDCAALLPIIEEAGGRFSSWQGERTTNGGDAISTNGRLFEEVIGLVSENLE